MLPVPLFDLRDDLTKITKSETDRFLVQTRLPVYLDQDITFLNGLYVNSTFWYDRQEKRLLPSSVPDYKEMYGVFRSYGSSIIQAMRESFNYVQNLDNFNNVQNIDNLERKLNGNQRVVLPFIKSF